MTDQLTLFCGVTAVFASFQMRHAHRTDQARTPYEAADRLSWLVGGDVREIVIFEVQNHPFIEAKIVRRFRTLAWLEWVAEERDDGLFSYSRLFESPEISVQKIVDSIRQQLTAPSA